MERKTCSFVENIGGVIFVVTMKPSDNAIKSTEEYIKALIADEVLSSKLNVV